MRAHVDDGVLCPAEDVADLGASQLPQETATGHAAEDVVMTQGDPPETAVEKGRADVADDGFDFGQLGHRAGIYTGARSASRHPMSRRNTLPSN